MIQHKRGDTFDRLLAVPDTYADGFWLGWEVTSQVRTARGKLIADLTPTWQDPEEETRVLRLFQLDTSEWPVGEHELDVQFEHVLDGTKLSTATVKVAVLQDVTQP